MKWLKPGCGYRVGKRTREWLGGTIKRRLWKKEREEREGLVQEKTDLLDWGPASSSRSCMPNLLACF